MEDTRLLENHLHISCEIWNCYRRADYYIGRKNTQRVATMNLCDECVDNILLHLEPKLVEKVLKGAKERDLLDEGVQLNEKESSYTPPNTSQAQQVALERNGEEHERSSKSTGKQEIFGEERSPNTTDRQPNYAEQQAEPANTTNESPTESGPQTEGMEINLLSQSHLYSGGPIDPLDEEPPALPQEPAEIDELQETTEPATAESGEGHGMEENQIITRLREKLQDINVNKLKNIAKKEDIPRYYEMKKDELVEALLNEMTVEAVTELIGNEGE